MAKTGRPRGFAAMDRNKQREIASMGGRAAHQRGTAHEFNSEEARRAGRLGGQASRGGHARFRNESQAAPQPPKPEGEDSAEGTEKPEPQAVDTDTTK